MPNSFKVARIGGIDIYVNWTWLLAVAFLTWSLGDYFHTSFKDWSSGTAYLIGFVSAILLFVTVLIHELSHSFTARAYGLPVHTISLFIFGGVSNLTQEPQSPKVELLVAIAGPLASLVLAGLFFVAYLVLHALPTEVTAVLGYLAYVNLILAIFNLIPGFPLDGGRVLRAILWMTMHSLGRATRIASNVGNGIGYLFILGGLLEAFVLNQVLSGIWLAFIGWFLHNAASSSYQQAIMDQMLAGVDVRDVMDPAPATTSADTPIDALVYRHMLNGKQRAVPVAGPDGRLEGLITLADLNEVPREEWNILPVGRVMVRADKLCTVTPDESLRNAMRTLAENNYHQLPVVTDGHLVGMLDRGHVLQYLHLRRQIGAGGAPPSGSAPRSEQPVG